MTLDPEKRAKDLQDGVHELLYERGLHDILTSFGEVWYTGSYDLDTMVWGDLDVHMVAHGEPLSLEPFFELGRRIAELDGIGMMVFENTAAVPQADLPDGLFWGIWLENGPLGERWKIDLWATERPVYDACRKTMDDIRNRISRGARDLILRTKTAILTPDGKTPTLSGYHVYQAILYLGMDTVEDVIGYLSQQGVKGI